MLLSMNMFRLWLARTWPMLMIYYPERADFTTDISKIWTRDLPTNLSPRLLDTGIVWLPGTFRKISIHEFKEFLTQFFIFKRLNSITGTQSIDSFSLKERFSGPNGNNLKELKDSHTFAQLIKGMILQPGGVPDLYFAPEVITKTPNFSHTWVLHDFSSFIIYLHLETLSV